MCFQLLVGSNKNNGFSAGLVRDRLCSRDAAAPDREGAQGAVHGKDWNPSTICRCSVKMIKILDPLLLS